MMGGRIVAIYAVHGAEFELRRIVLEVAGARLDRNAVGTGEPHPWDHLTFLVGGDVLNFVAKVHMPVNAADGPVRGGAAADFEKKSHAEFRVRLVGEKMRVGAVEVADVLLRPMTLLAGFLGWSKV